MNISVLKRGSARLVNALRTTCGPSPQRTALRMLARAEREERRIRERIAQVQAMRRRAFSLLGSKGGR